MSEPIVESAKRRATRFQIQKRSQDHKLQHKKKNLCILRIKEKINFPLHRLHQSKISVDKKGFYQGIETAGSLGHKERKSTRREDIDRTRIEKKPSYDTIYCPEGLQTQTPPGPPLSSIPCVTPSSNHHLDHFCFLASVALVRFPEARVLALLLPLSSLSLLYHHSSLKSRTSPDSALEEFWSSWVLRCAF